MPAIPTRPTPGSTPGAPTFAQLALRSEVHRVYGMFGLIGAMLLIATVRSRLATGVERFHPAQFVLMGAGLAYGAIPWTILRRCAARGLPMPPWLSIGNIFVEAAIPSAFIYLLFMEGGFPPLRAVTAPALFGYAMALILSTLRLSPVQCIISGSLCAAGHAAVVVAALAAARDGGPRTASPEFAGARGYFFVYPAAIFLAGLAAAYVAAQLRSNVRALIAETDARRRAETEISVAAEIQQGLLPRSAPQFPGFEIAFWNRPANQTGGDYYDWQPLPDGRLAVSLADVSGHGLGPALVAAFCRAYARATLHHDDILERTVARINALITDDLPAGRFVTFVVAVLSPGSPEVGLVSAGHGPMLIRRAATGVVEVRGADGMPLGISGSESFERARPVRLDDNDSLVLVTDGFFEWPRKDGDRFGIERLKGTISAGPLGAEETIAHLRSAVEAFTAGNPAPQPDDLSIVVIRRVAAAG